MHGDEPRKKPAEKPKQTPKREGSVEQQGVERSGAPGPATGNQPDRSAARIGLVDPDAVEDLDAVLDKVTGARSVSAQLIEELRRVAHRQRDVRNKRKLMLYAQQLADEKTFASLVDMDPWLRAITLEVKLITPGGRVGSDASLAGSPKRNWVERTPMGRLPKYIRIVANGIKGHSKSRRIALAVAAMKRWARGGDNVRPQVQAAAAKALAEWEALKASA
jgi:hypothetical protein